MGVTYRRLSGKGKFYGDPSYITGYSVQEDSTPLFGDDSTGGAGSIDVGATEVEDSVLFVGNQVRLDDTENGWTQGRVRSLDSDESGELRLHAESKLAKFVVERTAAPVAGTLAQVLEYYFSLVDIENHEFRIDPDLGAIYVAYPAWTDTVWTRLKDLCVAHNMEIALVSGIIAVRKTRQHTAYMARNSNVSPDVNVDSLAAYVEVNYYNYEPVVNSIVFPVKNTQSTVITLSSEEEAVVELQTDVSLTSILAPSPTTTAMLQINYSPNASYYIVHDGKKELDPVEWGRRGGFISAEIDPEDNTNIILRIRAGYHPEDGSYRIAYRGHEDQWANSMVIAGAGVRFHQESVVCATGADPELIVDNQSQTVNNFAISTRAQAWSVAMNVASKYAGPAYNISVSSTGIHRQYDRTSERELTADEFNAEYAGLTADQFNAQFAGDTVNDFNLMWDNEFEDEFVNQAFGNVGGARVEHAHNIFRIRQATITESGIDYTAERDIIGNDFDAAFSGMTMDEFNAQFAGMTFDEYSLMPLRRT